MVKQLTEKVITYEPDNVLRKGYRLIFKEIFAELNVNRWLIYQLFKREFVTIYRQSIFGILWAFIGPIVSVVAFILLQESGLFNIGDVGVPYVVYALVGLSFWQFFSSGLVAGSGSLLAAGSMITKINFSKKALVVSSMGRTLVFFLIQFTLALFSFVFFGVMPNVAIFLTPLLIMPLVLAILGLGFILSISQVVIRDIGNLLSFAITFLLLITPILYATPSEGIMAQLTKLNPLYYLISLPRDLIFTGTSSLWVGFLLSSVLSIIIFWIGLVAFHIAETRIAERT